MEKLRPVDQRLQYQITKLMQGVESRQASAAAAAAATDTKELRPGELTTGVEDEPEAEGGEGADEDDKDGIYRPPRIAQVEYTGDHVSQQERAERDLERKKARFQRSEFVRSLREEFTDAPTEVHSQQ